MYYYWEKDGTRPSVFYNMPSGELKIIMAFFENEIEEKEKKEKLQAKIMKKQGFMCPAMM